MGVYLYAVAASGRKKVDTGGIGGKVTVFPMVYRWKYWVISDPDQPGIRQSFNLARIERNARRAIANDAFQGFVALYRVEKGNPVYLLNKGECLWSDGVPVPGEHIGWIDERVADGSLFISPVEPRS